MENNYRPQGYVFTPVCQSFCSRGGGACMAGACMAGGVHGRGHAWWGCAWQGGMFGRGCAWQGACVAGGFVPGAHALHVHILGDMTQTALLLEMHSN